jgi:heme/copper-type cytochrome/quinol oxidase subunit 2
MSNSPVLRFLRLGVPLATLVLALTLAAGAGAQSKKDFAVVAHKYGYQVNGSGGEIHVNQDDLVRVTFSTDDIPHSFTLEDETYRIMRRAEPGKPVMFEFRADKAGRFPFKCTLTADPGCKEMAGVLVVDPRK